MGYFHSPVSLAAVGSTPNANGASLAGQQLTLQPADGSNPGLVTTGSQTFAGTKTFAGLSATSLTCPAFFNQSSSTTITFTSSLLNGFGGPDWLFTTGSRTGSVFRIVSNSVNFLDISGAGTAVFSGAKVSGQSTFAPANGASVTIVASACNSAIVSPAGATSTINAPNTPTTGQFLTIVIKNASGAGTTTSWNAVFKMAAWSDPANGFSASITFLYDGTNWKEVNRSGTNVPN